MPNPKSELEYKSVYELVVSVILSAQCTDIRVNKITPILFKQYPSFSALAEATVDEVYNIINSCSYPNNKSKYLVSLAKSITKNYNGDFPEEREEMEKLPGIGHKTASVIGAVAFNKPYFAVDTHVFRVANRLGLVKTKTPLETSLQLEKLFPPEIIPDAHHWLLLHGRYVCKARTPLCDECKIKEICSYIKCN
jgi:endonuclease-3